MAENLEPCLSRPRVLLVDDDRKLARLLIEHLNAHGFDTGYADSGTEGLERATSEPWDLVVLDVMLPRQDGFSVLRALRSVSLVPVLMLTARGGEDDQVRGLDSGADDYVAKTASSRELLARIRALLRRGCRATAPTAPPPPPRRLDVGKLHLDIDSRAAQLGSTSLPLTPVEFDLLLALARAKGKVRSREQLLDEARDREYEIFDRSIDVHIVSLRRKLGDDPRAPRYIRTVRTAGYLLIDPEAAALNVR